MSVHSIMGVPMTKPRTRAARKKATRAKLLEATYELFSEQGIVATRTLEVATAADVAHGTIFSHFATREDLVAAVVAEYGGQIAKRLETLVREPATLREVLCAHLAGLSEQEGFYSRLVMEGPQLPTSAADRLTDIQSTIAICFSAAAEREKAEGRIRFGRVDLLFDTWLGLIHHYICNRKTFATGKQPILIERGPELVDHFMELLSKEGS